MRDVERIDVILNKLGEAWRLVPDWRFGQLMVNMFLQSGCKDPYDPEDGAWLAVLEAFIEGGDLKKAMREHYGEQCHQQTQR